MLSRLNASKEKLRRKLDKLLRLSVLLRRPRKTPSESAKKQRKPQNFRGKLRQKPNRRDWRLKRLSTSKKKQMRRRIRSVLRLKQPNAPQLKPNKPERKLRQMRRPRRKKPKTKQSRPQK